MMWGWKRSRLDEREEIQSHIRIEADRLEADGLSRDEARAEARARFGDSPHLDPLDSSLRPGWLEVLACDTRYAIRRLIASPISSATILLSLVIGIGVNTAVFSLADQMLVRPLPVENPDELVQLEWEGRFIGQGGRGTGSLLPHPLFLALRADQQVFQALAARSPGEVTLATGTLSERVQTELVTGAYFKMLGINPFLGRLFSEEDDWLPDAHPVVILSHAYWQSRFGGDSTVVGRQVQVNARPMTVVGVAPPGFHGTDWSMAPSIWVPMMMNDLVHEWGRLTDRRVRFQHVFARLKPEVTSEQAERALEGWFQRYIRVDVQMEGWPEGVEPAEMEQYLASRLRVRPGRRGQARADLTLKQPMLILTAATALLLFLACLNVTNLLLAKAVSRQRDTSVKAALGASRRRIMSESLVETGLLAALGGAVGVLLAPAVSRWLLSFLSSGGPAMALHSRLDGRTLVAASAISVSAALLSGVGPAWFSASPRFMGALRVRASTAGGAIGLRKALVVGQVSLALVFLMGAGLFGKTLQSLRSEGPGFSTDRLVTFKVNPANSGYELLESKRLLRRLLEQVQAHPMVRDAGVAVWPIMEGSGWGNTVLVEGERRFETDQPLPMNAVSPGLFEALGAPIILGRNFDSRDVREEGGWGIRSAIVSQSFVDQYLPGEHPIGVRIDFGGHRSQVAGIEIVGVVRGYHEQAHRDSRPQVFFPIWERTAGTGSFYVRSAQPFEVLVPEIRRLVAGEDPLLAVSDLRTFDDQIDRLLIFDRMLAALGDVFAIFAALLGLIGIYAVLSFTAESRSKEMGIRVALGASQRAAGGLILGEALRLGAIGMAIALPVIWALGRLIENQLFGVDVFDPGIVAMAGGIVLAVVFCAGAVPAWRASHASFLEAFGVD